MKMKHRPVASTISLVTCVALASSPMGATASAAWTSEASAPEQPGPPTPEDEEAFAQPPAPQPSEDAAPVGGGKQVIVHVVNELPDEDRGLVKLARYGGTTTSGGGNVIIFTTKYEEICTEPCSVAVDVSERPIFFFIRDENAVSHGFRIKGDEQEVTLSVRPERRGMRLTGLYLSCLFLFPITIPLLILGRSKVSLAPGAPSAGQEFRKLKKAKA